MLTSVLCHSDVVKFDPPPSVVALSFAEFMSWAMTVWGGGKLVDSRADQAKDGWDYGTHPSRAHAKWLCSMGITNAQRVVDVDSRSPFHNKAEASISKLYAGKALGEAFAAFCAAASIPVEVQAYVEENRDRFSYKAPFNKDRVTTALQEWPIEEVLTKWPAVRRTFSGRLNRGLESSPRLPLDETPTGTSRARMSTPESITRTLVVRRLDQRGLVNADGRVVRIGDRTIEINPAVGCAPFPGVVVTSLEIAHGGGRSVIIAQGVDSDGQPGAWIHVDGHTDKEPRRLPGTDVRVYDGGWRTPPRVEVEGEQIELPEWIPNDRDAYRDWLLQTPDATNSSA
jgi:hypothetical protein